ncbi:MAG TPA: helix-turn-helix domain-containing protein [Thermopolyspora sp.]
MQDTAPATETRDFLIPDEIADEMRVNRMTVYRLIRRGELPALKVGRQYRVARAEFERYLSRSAA